MFQFFVFNQYLIIKTYLYVFFTLCTLHIGQVKRVFKVGKYKIKLVL